MNEIIKEMFPKLKDKNFQVAKAHWVPSIDWNKHTLKYIIVKSQKNWGQEKILQAVRERNQVTYKLKEPKRLGISPK